MDILFVCTGNTCRSCMAEAIFNNLCILQGINASSAGVSIVKNSKTSKNSASILKDNMNIDISDRHAVQLKIDMIEKSDMILTMTANIKGFLAVQFPHSKNKIYTLNEYVSLKGDIVDPFGGDISIYSETYKQLKKSILLLVDKIKEEEKY